MEGGAPATPSCARARRSSPHLRVGFQAFGLRDGSFGEAKGGEDFFGRFFPPTMAGVFAPGASSDKSFRTRLTFARSERVRSVACDGLSLIDLLVGSSGASEEEGGGGVGFAVGGESFDAPSRRRLNFRGQVKPGGNKKQPMACHYFPPRDPS